VNFLGEVKMLEFESKEQPAVKFWVSDSGYLCIEQYSHEFAEKVTFLLGPDAVETLEANIADIRDAQRKVWV
jgi:hypothetical protein